MRGGASECARRGAQAALRELLTEMREAGFAFDNAWFAPHFEFRFPRVGELASLTEQSHSAVSQHLAKLRAANLVESRRDAQTIYYRCSGGVGRPAASGWAT